MPAAPAPRDEVPSLYGDIRFHAKTRPHAVAVVRETGASITYAAFSEDIEKVTRALAREGFEPGTVVAVSPNGHYLHWLVLIALSRLGVVSASIEPGQIAVSGASAWITDGADGASDSLRVVRPRPDWLQSLDASQPYWIDVAMAPEAQIRIVLSSGTTGTPKRVLFTHSGFRRRYANAALSYGFHPKSRLLTPMSPLVVGGWAFPAAVWCVGGSAIILDSGALRTTGDIVQAYKPNVMFCSPAQLAGMAQRRAPDRGPAPGLTIWVGGAALPDAVNRQARARLTPSLHIIYGSTEASTITMCEASAADDRPGFAGHPVSYASFEIVDEEDNVLPAGSIGIVRTRGEGMSTHYYDDPETSAQCFRGGWFYPGDKGSVDASGALTIEGRVSEMMNLGGTKVSPDVIDAFAAQVPGVVEAGSFGMAGEGSDQLWIAIVMSESFDRNEFRRRFRATFPAYAMPRIARVTKLPRNEMQKVKRAELREQMIRFVASKQA